jgi:hypothetical protein
MPRGSKLGERRGGRQRATPNRRTVLTNRILVVAAANPAATEYELVLILAKDQDLAADTRMAIARKALLFGPSRLMQSHAAAINEHGRPPSKPRTKIGPDHEVNKGPASKRGGALAAKAGLATDLLFAVAQDTAANPADRRKAASQVAEFFLPKNARGRKLRRGKFPPDEYDVFVDPELATNCATAN